VEGANGRERSCLNTEVRSSSIDIFVTSNASLQFCHLSIFSTRFSTNMRVFSRLLATATDAGASQGFRRAPAALLPPIPLYRTILRTHRKRLGVEERVLGDMYVKAEFRAHREIDNPVQIVRRHNKLQYRVRYLTRNDRLDFFLNGNYTPRPSKVTPGKVTGWIKERLIR
jgi:hypothetical protein